MYNWSVDTTRLKKNHEKYEQFLLEQQINFGLNGQKLSLKILKKYWNSLNIDPQKQIFLKKIVWMQS